MINFFTSEGFSPNKTLIKLNDMMEKICGIRLKFEKKNSKRDLIKKFIDDGKHERFVLQIVRISTLFFEFDL